MGTHLRDMRIGAYQGMDRCATYADSLGSAFPLVFHSLLTVLLTRLGIRNKKCVDAHLRINTFVFMDLVFCSCLSINGASCCALIGYANAIFSLFMLLRLPVRCATTCEPWLKSPSASNRSNPLFPPSSTATA